MVDRIEIKNFKSVRGAEFTLKRVNVLIGANGAGKSNILEALSWAGAAISGKLDHEFLASRGIRVPSDPILLKSAFKVSHQRDNVDINLYSKEGSKGPNLAISLKASKKGPYMRWQDVAPKMLGRTKEVLKFLSESGLDGDEVVRKAMLTPLILKYAEPLGIANFMVYAPEASAIRSLEEEGQIQPIGLRGEGLFQLLEAMQTRRSRHYSILEEQLHLMEWFESVTIQHNKKERRLLLRDRNLAEGSAYIDQRVVNEGFLFALLYFALVISDQTPSFFAVDNIDAMLNPKLCRVVMARLAKLASQHDKQVIFTTHNAAILDGLNLHDPEQQLLLAYRSEEGYTKVRTIGPPKSLDGRPPVRMSEAFLRGYLGGVPGDF